ncbi:MAG: NapC/NirT family cytochrome c [Rubrivivax sp.]|nr:NapC/NirT family cytochrome c [Rubrivivax sp.]
MIHNFFTLVTRHWLSLLGLVIAVVGAVLMAMLFVMELSGFDGGPYLGILTYMVLPMVLVTGLVLIPVGVMRKRKLEARAAAAHQAPPRLPLIDLNDERTRGVVLVSLVVGLIAAVVLAAATYRGVKEMETVAFCGTTCHTVMQPEHTAFLRSPHSRLTCANCHIGTGADWFVKSKLSGSWQLIAVALKIYPTPIPSPVHNLRPARETCEQCHWPTKHVGDRLQVRSKFADDETNTESKTVILMKVGGQQGSTSSGIHWHVDPGVKIRYLTDRTRQKVYDIEHTAPDGKVKLYKTDDKPDGPTEWRAMDCVDCHNRPSHTFKMPAQELDAAMGDGRIDKKLPFIKREGLRVLQASYASHEEAREGIAREIEKFYKDKYPAVSSGQAGAVAAAGKALGDMYTWNVFPKMKVTWGTYPNNLGHSDEAPGCYRCHDKRHSTAQGDKIGRNCKTCHAVLAEDEPDPEILKKLKP